MKPHTGTCRLANTGMQRRAALALAACALLAGGASAQTAKDLTGSWILVSNTLERDGKTIDSFGPNPKGTVMFDSAGRFAIAIVRADLPKIAANNRDNASAEEAAAVLKGSLAYFGSYTVNEADKVIALQVDGATFANWTGTTVKRQFALSGDQLKLINAAPSIGGGVATVIWRRAK